MSISHDPKLIQLETTNARQTMSICDFLALETSLSKACIKKALSKGAGWANRSNSKKLHRIRKAKHIVNKGDKIQFYYDPKVLNLIPLVPALLHDKNAYSIWNKPAGMLSQGNKFGDHCSLLRIVELYFTPRRKTYLVHRLDRETSGLMIIAHNKATAGYFSELFKNNTINKQYTVEIKGVWKKPPKGVLDYSLDGKNAQSNYQLMSVNEAEQTSTMLVTLKTGRTHQIRKHFATINHPVMGDPRYGKGNKNKSGLKLMATTLSYICPIDNKTITINL